MGLSVTLATRIIYIPCEVNWIDWIENNKSRLPMVQTVGLEA